MSTVNGEENPIYFSSLLCRDFEIWLRNDRRSSRSAMSVEQTNEDEWIAARNRCKRMPSNDTQLLSYSMLFRLLWLRMTTYRFTTANMCLVGSILASGAFDGTTLSFALDCIHNEQRKRTEKLKTIRHWRDCSLTRLLMDSFAILSVDKPLLNNSLFSGSISIPMWMIWNYVVSSLRNFVFSFSFFISSLWCDRNRRLMCQTKASNNRQGIFHSINSICSASSSSFASSVLFCCDFYWCRRRQNVITQRLTQQMHGIFSSIFPVSLRDTKWTEFSVRISKQ